MRVHVRADLTSTGTPRRPISPMARLVRICLVGLAATTMVACPAVEGPDVPGTDPPSDDDDGVGDTTWGVDPDLEIGDDDDDTSGLDLTEDDLAIEVESPQIDGLDSSARLRVTWNELPSLPEILQLYAQDVAENSPIEVAVGVGETEAVVPGLRSSTAYSAWLQACNGDTCVSSAPGSGTTAEEVWRMTGTGNQVVDAAPIVSDGNTKPYAIRKGEGAADEGHVQLWYDPLPDTGKGVYVASQPAPPTDDPATWTTFDPVAGYGLLREDTPEGDGLGPRTFQVVPLAANLGGGMRIYFEGEIDGQPANSMHSVDSVDGWAGRDFHPGDATVCSWEDLEPGGECGATPILTPADTGIDDLIAIRQGKLAFPTMDEWRWDGAAGTPMLVMLDLEETENGCTDRVMNTGYAVWDGGEWVLEMDGGGCPELFRDMQAPLPVHTGGSHYKLYFSHHSDPDGVYDPDNKPIRALHADTRSTGDPELLDFQDWEALEEAREIRFLWPDGSEMTTEEVSALDDFVVLSPTGESGDWVLYTNISCPHDPDCGAPFITSLVLLNP